MRTTISPEPALLGFLLNGPMHGYDLYKQVDQELAPVWHLGLSQMYAIFKSFAARGWVRVRVQAQGARPSKNILELTPIGRKAFETWRTLSARGLREFRVDFFLRLYFARIAGVGSAKELVECQTAASRRELESLRILKKSSAPEYELFELTRDFRIQQLTTILKWLQANRAKLIQTYKPISVSSARKNRSLRSSSARTIKMALLEEKK
jgi:DNA-binding PadR family transcriptional regulator